MKIFHWEIARRINKLKKRKNIQTITLKDSKVVLVSKETIKDITNITIEPINLNIPIITTQNFPTTAIKEEDIILGILKKIKILAIIGKAGKIISTKLKKEIESQLQTFRQPIEKYLILE